MHRVEDLHRRPDDLDTQRRRSVPNTRWFRPAASKISAQGAIPTPDLAPSSAEQPAASAERGAIGSEVLILYVRGTIGGRTSSPDAFPAARIVSGKRFFLRTDVSA
jgi:hypothetical protein